MTHRQLKCMAPHPAKAARLQGRICGAPGTRLPRSIAVEWTGRWYTKGRSYTEDEVFLYSPCHNCGAVTEYRIVAPESMERAA